MENNWKKIEFTVENTSVRVEMFESNGNEFIPVWNSIFITNNGRFNLNPLEECFKYFKYNEFTDEDITISIKNNSSGKIELYGREVKSKTTLLCD